MPSRGIAHVLGSEGRCAGDFDSCLGQWQDALKSYQKAYEVNPKVHTMLEDPVLLYQRHRAYDDARRVLEQAAATGSSSPSVVEEIKAAIRWEERGDTSAYHAIFNDPGAPWHPNGTATPLKTLTNYPRGMPCVRSRVLRSY